MINTSYKIKVKPEQSKKIQEICFKNNIPWLTGSRRVQYIYEVPFTKIYLLINPTEGITHTDSEDVYYMSLNQRISADEFIRLYSDSESSPEK